MSDREKLIREEIEQSELTRNDPLPAGAVGVRKNQSGAEVYSLRLPTEVIETLERIATERDIPTSALVRGYILDAITNQERVSARTLIERAENDLHRLKTLLA